MKKYRKDQKIEFRVTDIDYQWIRMKAEKSNEKISPYCRKKVLQKDEQIQQKNQKELVYQIRKIGVNINQAVARMNAGHPFSDDGTRLLCELEKIYALMEQAYGDHETGTYETGKKRESGQASEKFN